MDPDSFLNLLSPGINEMDVDWGSPSDTDFYAEHAPALAWLSDGFVTEGAREDDAHPSHGSTLNSIVNRRIVDNASEYSSVLKLSDIASALHNFSRAAGIVGSTNPLVLKPSPTQSCSSIPRSPSCPDLTSNMVSGGDALHTSLFCAHPVDNSSCSALSRSDAKPSPPCDMRAISRSSCLNAILGLDTLCREDRSGEIGYGVDGFKANERESSDKLSNDSKASERELSSKISNEENRWEFSDDENDNIDSDDEIEYAEDEDVKPCVSHVRIIRRPNSNCYQGMAPSPKRMKFTHVKAEAASSCEMASSQEDKEGRSNSKQMKKEGMSQREVHILSERQRRKSMRESFSILQSLVPKLKLKHTDRITVLTEVITYIQALRGTLEELERKKADILDLLGMTAKTRPRRHLADMPATVTYVNTSNNSSSDDKAERSSGWCSLQNGELVAMVEVTVRMCGADVFITLNTPRRKGVWSRVLSLLQKYSVEISNATLASSGDSSFHCIHGKATNMCDIEGVDLQEKLEGVIVKELGRRPKK